MRRRSSSTTGTISAARRVHPQLLGPVDGVDCAISYGKPVDEGLVAQAVMATHLLTCAAPAYLQRRGVPRVPADFISSLATASLEAKRSRVVLAAYAAPGPSRLSGVPAAPPGLAAAARIDRLSEHGLPGAGERGLEVADFAGPVRRAESVPG